jgi:hypothetical protein
MERRDKPTYMRGMDKPTYMRGREKSICIYDIHRMYSGKYQRVCPEELSGKLPICARHIGTYLHVLSSRCMGQFC